MVWLRPHDADDLGLREALSDRLLPIVVAAQVFLAALGSAGAIASWRVAQAWRTDTGDRITIMVPQPNAKAPDGRSRADSVAADLAALPGADIHRLMQPAVALLLQPWLGDRTASVALLLPAVFEVRLTQAPAPLQASLDAELEAAAPGTLVEREAAWLDRVAALARGVQAVSALALCVTALVTACVVAVVARAGLAARRGAIAIVHGLGATDRAITSRFASRVTLLTLWGALAGVVVAAAVLLAAARLAAPFGSTPAPWPGVLPRPLWALLAVLPLAAALIALVTTQATVRLWLVRLP